MTQSGILGVENLNDDKRPHRRPTRMWFSLGLALMGVAAAIPLAIVTTSATAKEPLGRQWPSNQQRSMDQVDHSPFDTLLKRYVDQDGYVNYGAWHNSAADRQALQQYLTSLSQASPTVQASREGQLAFWINAYNAVTLEGILQVYPTDSIRSHTSKLGGYNLWKDLPLLVGGQPYSLDAIEHQVLRKMGEPRVHFAIVCASIGCPRLLNEAYVRNRVSEQLAVNTRDFFARSQNLRVDSASHTLHLSSILDWFGSDFGAGQSEQLKALAAYLPAEAQAIAASPQARVRFQEYNWSLNDQARKPASAVSRGAGSTRR
jgi:hypothetical protein